MNLPSVIRHNDSACFTVEALINNLLPKLDADTSDIDIMFYIQEDCRNVTNYAKLSVMCMDTPLLFDDLNIKYEIIRKGLFIRA